MAILSFVTHTPVLNLPLLSRLYIVLSITNLILHLHLFTFTFSKPITPSDTENYLLPMLLPTQVLKPELMSEQKLNPLKPLSVLLMPKKEKFVSKNQSNIVVLIEPYGITIYYHFLLHSIL